MATFVDPYRPDQPPLPSWESPRPGEPAHGFVLRHAGLNDRSSVRTMLIGHGLNGRSIQPDECLAFALSLPFRGHDALRHATPEVSPECVTLLGQSVRRRQWQIERRRFCPACVAEDPYHRAWWDLLDFKRCPHHDLDVIDRDANGRFVPWWYPSFMRSPSGVDLARYGVPRRTRPNPSLEAYILGRLGAVENATMPLLDGLATLGDAIDAVRMLGRIALWGKAPARPAHDVGIDHGPDDVMRAGFAVAARGERAVVALLHDIADARTGAAAARVKKSCFGWISEALWAEERGSHIEWCEALLDRVMVERGRAREAQAEARAAEGGEMLSLPAFADELGMPPARLRGISEALGIHAVPEKGLRNRYLAFDARDADLVRQTVRAFVDRDGAAALLGLTTSCVGALVAANLLRPFAGIGGRRPGNRFRPQDVRVFADRLLAGSTMTVDVDSGLARLGSLSRTDRFDPAKLVAGLLAPNRSPSTRIGPLAGDLLVPVRRRDEGPDAMAAARAAIPRKPGISRYDAASRLGLRPEVVDALIAGHYLARPVGDKGDRRVDQDSVDSFGREWGSTDIYRETIGHLPGDQRTGEHLETLGVSVLRFTLADGHRTFLADRASARSVLGLGCDPDAPESGSAKAFETVLLAGLARKGSFVRSGQTGLLSLRSVANDLVLRVDVRRAERTIVLELVRYTTAAGDLDGTVAFAQAASSGRILIREGEGKLAAALSIEAPELANPMAWAALVARVVSAAETFRTAFPQRRRATKKR